jgi:PAS domain-containing protein
VVLNACETLSLILREEHRLGVFGNRVLWRIFGLKKDEVMGEWWKLHNEEHHDLSCSPCIIRMIKSRRMRWTEHVARTRRWRMRVYMLWRPRYRWVDNIKMDLEEIWWCGMDWIVLAQDREQWRALVNERNELSSSIKRWEVPEWLHN